jgi:hypothetical protein
MPALDIDGSIGFNSKAHIERNQNRKGILVMSRYPKGSTAASRAAAAAAAAKATKQTTALKPAAAARAEKTRANLAALSAAKQTKQPVIQSVVRYHDNLAAAKRHNGRAVHDDTAAWEARKAEIERREYELECRAAVNVSKYVTKHGNVGVLLKFDGGPNGRFITAAELAVVYQYQDFIAEQVAKALKD